MTITCLSDTHGFHRRIKNIPESDIIIHAGDISNFGEEHQVLDFLNWFSDLPHQYKIFVAGNHDFIFENEPKKYVEKIIPKNVIYLNDSGYSIDGINIFCSPITPRFMDWAFNRDRGRDIQNHWKLIPANTDILITHGPPFGKLDTNKNNFRTGCEDLLKTIGKIKPKYHIYGHIHEAYGMTYNEHTTFINASILDEHYRIKNKPVVIEYD